MYIYIDDFDDQVVGRYHIEGMGWVGPPPGLMQLVAGVPGRVTDSDEKKFCVNCLVAHVAVKNVSDLEESALCELCILLR